MTNREVDLALEKIGLMIQTERPLHEPAMSYLEVRGLSRFNEVLNWWKRHPKGCSDPLWMGRGHRAAAYREARKLLKVALKEGKVASL